MRTIHFAENWQTQLVVVGGGGALSICAPKCVCLFYNMVFLLVSKVDVMRWDQIANYDVWV
jgi:hypothetical protein